MTVDESYRQTLDYMLQKLPMFSRIGKAALKNDLSNTLKLCELTGNPHQMFQSVHIAGTNGKGSVSHALAAILQDAGYKTGLYTSPHLIDFRERIKINGQVIEKEWVTNFIEKYRAEIEYIKPSFFEITVAMAFAKFAEEKIDIAIVETGLGGRLDSTNVITPLLSIITNISYDHKDLLGSTLAEIAAEKAGIMKPKIPTIIGEQHEETKWVFFQHSIEKHSPLYYAQAMWDIVTVPQEGDRCRYKAVHNLSGAIQLLETDLLGSYQKHNLKTTLAASELLALKGYNLPMKQVMESLSHVKTTTGLRGRWDKIQDNPTIICDVAHNPAGLLEVLKQWSGINAQTKHIVVGFVKDKDVAEALSLFPLNAKYYFCNAAISRALPAEDLMVLAEQIGISGKAYPSVGEAISAAKTHLGEKDALLITGSFFIVGEALEFLNLN